MRIQINCDDNVKLYELESIQKIVKYVEGMYKKSEEYKNFRKGIECDSWKYTVPRSILKEESLSVIVTGNSSRLYFNITRKKYEQVSMF